MGLPRPPGSPIGVHHTIAASMHTLAAILLERA